MLYPIWILELADSRVAKRLTLQKPSENIWKLPRVQANTQAVFFSPNWRDGQLSGFSLEDNLWKATSMSVVDKTASVLFYENYNSSVVSQKSL